MTYMKLIESDGSIDSDFNNCSYIHTPLFRINCRLRLI